MPEKNQYAAKDLGRATKGAAKGLLVKLYMLKKDFTAAERYCLEIIQSNQYSLVPKYADIFTQAFENGSESLFEIQAAAYPAAVAGPGASPYNMVQGVRHHLEFRIIRIGLDREPQIAHEFEHLGVVGQHQPFDLGQSLLARHIHDAEHQP